MLSPETISYIRQELLGITGKERKQRIDELALKYQKHPGSIARIAKKAGVSLRKERSDKGRSKIETDKVKLGAALLLTSRRLTNSIPLPACDAKEILEDSGLLKVDVSDAWFAAKLRESKLSAKHLCAPSPHKTLLSDHPNHVWQFDVTNCLQYFFDDKGFGERDQEMELDKNRLLSAAKKIKKQLLRYVIVDHCTGAFYLRYFYATGERAEDGERCFFEAMRPKDELIERLYNDEAEITARKGQYKFHGVPFCVYADKGSISRAKKFQNLFDALHIRFDTHMPGNPRAKGMVEGLMRIINRFEARLIFKRPQDLDEINRWALDWCIKMNATHMFREFAPRSVLWSMITSEQLRLCPEESTFWRLVSTDAIKKKVSGALLISYSGRKYRVEDPNLAHQYVFIRENAYESPAIDVYGNGFVWLVKPVPLDNYGRLSDGVRFGEYKSLKDTAVQTAKKELESIAEESWGITWKGTGDKRRAVAPPAGFKSALTVFNHQADKIGNMQFMDKQGVELDVKQPGEIINKPVTHSATEIPRSIIPRKMPLMAFLVMLKDEIGAISKELNRGLKELYTDGVDVDAAPGIIEGIKNGNMRGGETHAADTRVAGL